MVHGWVQFQTNEKIIINKQRLFTDFVIVVPRWRGKIEKRICAIVGSRFVHIKDSNLRYRCAYARMYENRNGFNGRRADRPGPIVRRLSLEPPPPSIWVFFFFNSVHFDWCKNRNWMRPEFHWECFVCMYFTVCINSLFFSRCFCCFRFLCFFFVFVS